MNKIVRYLLAVVSIIVLYFLVFGVIGVLVEWSFNIRVFVTIVFVIASIFIWRAITKSKSIKTEEKNN